MARPAHPPKRPKPRLAGVRQSEFRHRRNAAVDGGYAAQNHKGENMTTRTQTNRHHSCSPGTHVDRIMSFFTPDAVYHNVPVAPIKGTKAIAKSSTPSRRVRTIASHRDHRRRRRPALAERVDRFTLKSTAIFRTPRVRGELRNGKITASATISTWKPSKAARL
jgi:hypothetical protein